MTAKLPYTYTVLRYVHDAISGEFLNAGVVLHVPAQRKLLCRTRNTIGRIKGVFPDLDRTAFKDAMDSVERAVKYAARDFDPDRLWSSEVDAASLGRIALPKDDSALQWSPVGSGLTEDTDKTLDRLFLRYITKYDSKSEHRRTDDDVWRPVREKLAARGVAIELVEKTVIGSTDQISFKHAWKNGEWHAYQPLSLDMADAEGIKDKVRKWRGHLDAAAEGSREHVKLHLIVGEPQNPALISACKNALSILRLSNFKPEIVEESQVDDLVTRIEDELRHHHLHRA